MSNVTAMDKEQLLAALPEVIEQICDPEIEWSEDPGRADGAVRRGHAGVRESVEQWVEGFERYSVTPERFEDYGDNVLVIAREAGRGAASGVEISSPIHAVLTLRDGRILRYREFY